jgi:hypothetical protein
MTKYFICFVLSATVIIACRKEKLPANYEAVDRQFINRREAQMKVTPIKLTDQSGLLIVPGTVFLFKTNQGLFGKMKFNFADSLNNYLINISGVVFNSNGSIRIQDNDISVNGTWLCDLDSLVESNFLPEADFHNNRQTTTNTELIPLNGAKILKYSF